MKPLAYATVALLLASALNPSLAQPSAPTENHDSHHPAADSAVQDAKSGQGNPGSTSANPSEPSEGEITRWEPRTLKVTLRHGEIKNLGMPPMTMVFRVHDARMLAPFQTGDKVRFRAERRSTGYFITLMEAAR